MLELLNNAEIKNMCNKDHAKFSKSTVLSEDHIGILESSFIEETGSVGRVLHF